MRQKKRRFVRAREDKNQGNGLPQLFCNPDSLAYINMTLVPWKTGNSGRNKRPIPAKCFGKSSHTYIAQFTA